MSRCYTQITLTDRRRLHQMVAAKVQNTSRGVHGPFARRLVMPNLKERHDALGVAAPRVH
ncbi:MAG TPA: hypothetical protein DDW73_04730 [Rhizobium sp.]|nr:hypothetical protein [Rhizobium sp.]